MKDEDYELLPHAELEELREEVAKLKRNPLGHTEASVSLLQSMNELNKNITLLVNILKSANDDMVRAFHDGSVQEQVRKLREENAKIAHGIVAVAELVKDVKKGGTALDEAVKTPHAPSMPPPQPRSPQPSLPGAQIAQHRNLNQDEIALNEDELSHELNAGNPFEFPGEHVDPIIKGNLPRPGMPEPAPPRPPGQPPLNRPLQQIQEDDVPPPPPR